eukprot:7371576-Prymnesium_polylepis.1
MQPLPREEACADGHLHGGNGEPRVTEWRVESENPPVRRLWQVGHVEGVQLPGAAVVVQSERRSEAGKARER